MTRQHQRACEAARHWDEYAIESKKRRSPGTNQYSETLTPDSEKGTTRNKLAKRFGVGENSIELAHRLMLDDIDRFERVAAGLEPLPNRKDFNPCVYFIGHVGRPDLPIKIGKASSVSYRRAELQTAHYTELIVIFTLEGYSELEKELHDRFMRKHVRGEWFALTQDDLDYIIKEFS